MLKVQYALFLLSYSTGLIFTLDICEYQMNGIHLSHPADCNKFVECQNGKTNRIMSCPLGLHFNRFKGVCDLRQRAFCEVSFMNFANETKDCSACCALYGCFVNPECPEHPGTSTTPDTPTSTETCVTPETPTTSETVSTPGTPETPDTPSTPPAPETLPTVHTPTPTSPCATPETPTTSETVSTPGTHETPDTPSTPSAPETPPTDHTPTPTSPEIPATPQTPSPNDKNCLSNSTACTGEPDGSVTHVNGTCNQYIVCTNGCAVVFSCPNNLQYNTATRKCDYPQNVDCPWQSMPPRTGPSGVTCAQHGKCAGQQDGKLFSDPNGNGYIVCQCECEVERPCPAGTKFDETLLTCAQEEANENSKRGDNFNEKGINRKIPGVVCNNDIQICKNQTDGTLLPIDGVCNKFYKCNFGCAVEDVCPNNLIYNPSRSHCDYPQNYKCPWPYTPSARPIAAPSCLACPSGGRCTGQVEGTILPSLITCSKYVMCQCECEVEMECPAGLLWDNELLTCNYPRNVVCDLDSLNNK